MTPESADVRFHALGVEDAGGQAEERVDVGLLEEFAAVHSSCAAFEEGACIH